MSGAIRVLRASLARNIGAQLDELVVKVCRQVDPTLPVHPFACAFVLTGRLITHGRMPLQGWCTWLLDGKPVLETGPIEQERDPLDGHPTVLTFQFKYREL